MFLATTADPRLWDSQRKMLFLGNWCLLHDQRERWEALDHEVLPYPFDDRERLYRAYQDLQPLYRAVLQQLAAGLNTVHGTTHTLRFWEIVVGYWLRECLEVLHERYVCLQEALASGKVHATKIPAPSCHIVPRDSLHFAALYEGDFFNAQLYGQILRELRNASLDIVEVEIPAQGHAHQSRSLGRRLMKTAKDAICTVSLAGSRWNRVVMASTYFPVRDLIELSIRCRSFPLLDTPRWPVAARSPVDTAGRAAVRDALANGRTGANAFEDLLPALISSNLPRIFLEEFRAVRSIVQRWFPRSPKLVVTANSYAYNDLFKHWTARAVERGVPLAILQHGGGYGCARWYSSEDYEARIADRYYTFGWDDRSKSNVVPWSSSRLRQRVRRSARASAGDILWVVVSYPRYAYVMYAVPVGPQVLSYLDDQHRFARAVSPEVRKLLLYRPYPLEYGWCDEDRLRDAMGDIRTASTALSMQSQLAKSRLFVGTFNATAFLETFVADVPTVLYWDKRLWELRPDAEAHFERLERVGILHGTPERAAEFIESIYRDPKAWWGRSEVRDAVGSFCDRYARATDRSLQDWQSEFERIASLAFKDSDAHAVGVTGR